MPTIYTDKKEFLPERHPEDFYETPIELCRAVYTSIPEIGMTVFDADNILDPGCGTGNWGVALHDIGIDALMINLHGVDIINRMEKGDNHFPWWPYSLIYEKDYLKWNTATLYDLIVGNPPYKFAEEFVRKSLSLLKHEGKLAFLLKTTFLNSQGRATGLFAEYPPKAVYISGRRPSFSGDKKTNAEDYCVIVWEKGYRGETKLDWFMWNYD